MFELLFLLGVLQLSLGHPSMHDEFLPSNNGGVDAMLHDVSNNLKAMGNFKFQVPNPYPDDPKYLIYPCLAIFSGQTVCGPNAVCSVDNSTTASCSCNSGFVHVPHKDKQFNCVYEGNFNDNNAFQALLKDIEEVMSSVEVS